MLRVFKQYYPIRNIFFVIGEGLLIFIVVLPVSFTLMSAGSFAVDILLLMKILLVATIGQICMYYSELYDFEGTQEFIDRGTRILRALGIAAVVLAFVYYLFPGANIDSEKFAISSVIVALIMIAWRVFLQLVFESGIFNQNIILLGSGQVANDIDSEIRKKKDCGYTVALQISEMPFAENISLNRTSKLLELPYSKGLCDRTKELAADKIVVAMNEKSELLPANELLECRLQGISIIDGDQFYEMLTGKLIVEKMNPNWLVFTDGFKNSTIHRLTKRMIDVFLSVTMTVILFPLMVITAILIKLDSKGPVFYTQDRVGKKAKIFRIYKFRSMINDAEKLSGPVYTRENDRRITKIGKYLRKWRIDEVPQLWNVIKGDMSLVGPRPERGFLVEMFGRKIPHYDKRFYAKPGITGWAQVNFGYGDSLEDYIEKLNYDLFYIKNRSILLDLMILIRTVKTVLLCQGSR
jgi:sugar transferase (PEP-CTERM system associated)